MRRGLLGLAGLCAALVAGCGRPASLQILDGDADLTQQDVDFGTVAVSHKVRRTLTLRDVGDGDVVVGSLGAELALREPFRVVGGTCATGTRLTPKSPACTLVFELAPTRDGRVSSPLVVGFTDDAGHGWVTGTLTGAGRLDCSLAEDLTTARADGVTAANKANAADAERGRADGEKLTYQDGYAGGYDGAYQAGYDAGYHDPQAGYDPGYAQGYAAGHADGVADPQACARGTGDGGAVGATEGYAAGQADAYSAGYNDGYSSGYAAGASDCDAGLAAADQPQSLRKDARSTHAPSDPAVVQACYQQGFDATRRGSAYEDAFEQAKLHNADYQAGLAAGGGDGRADGEAAGRTQGWSDGLGAGRAAGYADGTAEAYQGCYDAAYGPAFNAAYADGGASGAGDAGEQAGYSDGYGAGYGDRCG